MIHLNKAYWNFRYAQDKIGWDVGSITTPLKEYIDQLTDKSLRILVPGAGNAYEAEYLYHRGFKNVNVLDISDKAIKSFQTRFPDFPKDQLYNEDFFDHRNSYDLIIEQTFFCAIEHGDRRAYVRKCFDLLDTKGKLIGLLWNHEFGNPEPPFGGSKSEYRDLFNRHFRIDTMELSYNSIEPRAGRELFIKLIKND